MVAGRICLYIERARKRGRIRNREAAGTHTYLSRIRFAKFSSFFHSFRMPVWAYEAFVRVRTRQASYAWSHVTVRDEDKISIRPQPRRSTDKTVILFLCGGLLRYVLRIYRKKLSH